MIPFALLEHAWLNHPSSLQLEHTHLNFYDYNSDKAVNSSICPVTTINCPKEIKRPDLVLDVNTKEQFDFISDIYKYFSNTSSFFGIRDIIGWYDNIYQRKKI